MIDWTGNHVEKLKAIEVHQYLLENQQFITDLLPNPASKHRWRALGTKCSRFVMLLTRGNNV